MSHVILVDDNTRAIEGLRRHILWGETGCICVGTASNGVEALDLCRSLLPDIVITDVKMPQMDGLELCKHLHAEFPGLHLIVISAYDDFAYAQKAMVFGVENYILKPIDDKKIEEITRLLKQINETSQKHTARISSFFNSTIITDLANAINEGNADKVDNLFQQTINSDATDFRSVKDLSTNLLAALYRHIVDIGMPANVDGRTLPESLAMLQTFHSPGALSGFVSRQYRWVCDHISRNKNPNKQIVVDRVRKYIEENFTDAKITTYSIAHRFHISQSYLCQIYREIEKTSINALVTELRINRACQLITTSEMPLQEVSHKVGYPDPHYFARVFRKVKGIAPSDYKDISRRHG